MNKYVTFVSDEIFLEEVEKVVDAYATDEDLSKTPWEVLSNSSETIDQFKTLFDIYSNRFNLNDWKNFEIPRQHDKKASNRIGDFHQNLLGRVDGWVNLGRGHPTGMDLKKEDDTIWMELKNKYNTMNSSSLRDTRFKCEELAEKYPNAKVYWAYIVSQNYESFDKTWIYRDNKENVVHEIIATRVYIIVMNFTIDINKDKPSSDNAPVNDQYDMSKFLTNNTTIKEE